jgi:ketosteroid isomerase-like protein
MRGEISNVLTAGDVALVMNRWQLEGTLADGAPVEMRGHSADVLRRASDGGWRILIDDPWGGSV